ncbi:DUF1631 family protein [Azohydromonas sediminis]|uniref:DUF1631 family protein n=1 Tax=Azohydromonas sediminis TaxID=2259674 RepID=UPI001F1A309A
MRRLHDTAQQAAQRCVESLGLTALTTMSARERDGLLAAQFELNRNLSAFELAFGKRLQEQVERALDPYQPSGRSLEVTDWTALRLVDDAEVEAQVSADRMGLAIQHACEWELRELDGYLGSLLHLEHPDHQRNPLRPEIIGKALVAAVESVSDQPHVRQVAVNEIGRGLASMMPGVYREIIAELRDSGLQPLSLARRTTQRGELGRDTGARSSSLGEFAAGTGGAHAAPAAAAPGAGTRFATHGGDAPRAAAATGGSTIGHVDAQLGAVIRRLAHLGASMPDTGAGEHGGDSAALPASSHGSGVAVAPNLIYAHREELRQASSGALDHMVIDVVGTLFEHILSDPKVPPQMARQIARLQLPVLRVALGDITFFSSRRHPVRRFVNRIASLTCAFDDFSDGPGKEFLRLVRDLVQQIVEGDFDQMALYERKLSELEAFSAAQARQDLQAAAADAPQLLEDKEQALLLQQRYVKRLEADLAGVALPEFLRTFVAQVWSQAIVHLSLRHGEDSERARRARQVARELLLSVLPKGTPAERKAFVLALPPLMKDLNEGLAQIGWPEDAKKVFFSQLLPAHAESLKSGSISQLDYNLLARRLDAIFGAPLPRPGDRVPGVALPVLDDVVAEPVFSADEAQRVGLVSENAVDWTQKVDIDLSAEEPVLTADDVRLEGLPAPDAIEPASGAALAQHVQVGVVYRMHLDGEWHKVRLTYVSPNRTFFAFTRGRKHQRTISMTSRMLTKMCEAGRLRAFENAHLLERATARARRQLAALGQGASRSVH